MHDDRKNSAQRTKSSNVIIEHAEERGLPTKLCIERANKTHDGRENEDGDVQPIQFIIPITPAEGWEGFLSLECMGHIVVGDVNVNRDMFWVCENGREID